MLRNSNRASDTHRSSPSRLPVPSGCRCGYWGHKPRRVADELIATKGAEHIRRASSSVATPRCSEHVRGPTISSVVTRGTEHIRRVGGAITAPSCSEHVSGPTISTVVTRGTEHICCVASAIATPGCSEHVRATTEGLCFQLFKWRHKNPEDY